MLKRNYHFDFNICKRKEENRRSRRIRILRVGSIRVGQYPDKGRGASDKRRSKGGDREWEVEDKERNNDMNYNDLMNQSAELFPITKWLLVNCFDQESWFRYQELENLLRSTEYNIHLVGSWGDVDKVKYFKEIRAEIDETWTVLREMQDWKLGRIEDKWIQALWNVANEGRTPSNLEWWKVNQLWDANKITILEDTTKWSVKITATIDNEVRTWEGCYLKAEGNLEGGTEATQTREQWTTGSKWLDKILNRDNPSHLKAIMLQEAVASWRDGAWRTKAGHDVTRWVESSYKRKWLKMRDHHWETLYRNWNMETGLSDNLLRTNNYRVRMWGKLAKLRERKDKEKFEKLARMLWKSSWAFRISLIDQVLPKYYEIPERNWKKIWEDLMEIRRWDIPAFTFRRVNIPKPDGSTRPLAVPNVAWRIKSKYMLLITELWIGKEGYAEHQFGAIPGKGTTEAWNYTWERIIPQKCIMEFDLAKCFDSIKLTAIEEVMEKHDLPDYLKHYIKQSIKFSNEVLPRVEKEAEWTKLVGKRAGALENAMSELLNEEEREMLAEMEEENRVAERENLRRTSHFHNQTACQNLTRLLRLYPELEPEIIEELQKTGIQDDRNVDPEYKKADKDRPYWNLIKKNSKEKDRTKGLHRLLRKTAAPARAKDFDAMQAWMEEEVTGEDEGRQMYEDETLITGLPQGWALSPMLTNLVLKDVLERSKEKVLYLDDGLIAGEKPEDLEVEEMIERLNEKGLSLSNEKTSWIKVDGVWRKPLKFLGTEYDGETWKAATRAGGKIVLKDPERKDWGSFENSWGNSKDTPLIERLMSQMKTSSALLDYMYNEGKKDEEGKEMSSDELWVRAWKKYYKGLKNDMQAIAVRKDWDMVMKQQKVVESEARHLGPYKPPREWRSLQEWVRLIEKRGISRPEPGERLV